jgi:Zn finger protein HypA/HybF involved in hydrogenase expression
MIFEPKKCRNCKSDFEPKKGLINYCSLSCRNSRGPRTIDEKRKISESLTRTAPWKNYSKEQRKEWSAKGNKSRKEKAKLRFEHNVLSAPWNELTAREKRTRIFLQQDKKCNACGIDPIWNNRILKFELDHIDGVRSNNARENLQLICPNCHSQTNTYKVGNNKSSGGILYSDQLIISALERNSSAYSAMKEIGMNPHGGNYVRLRKIVKKYEIKLPYSF